MKGMTTVFNLEEMPKFSHFVILEFATMRIPGDERSKTDPGHGYGPHAKAYTKYRWTANRDAWIEEITKLSLDSSTAGKFVAFRASERASIDLKAQVFVRSP